MDKRLAKLLADMAALKGKGVALCDAADNDGREMTADEVKAFDKIADSIEAKQGEIDAAQAQSARRATMAAVQTLATPGAASAPLAGSTALTPYGHNADNTPDPSRFMGFKDMGDFGAAVRQSGAPGGVMDSRFLAAPSNFHEGGGTSGEGFMVPPAFSDTIFEIMVNLDEFGPLIDEEPTTQRSVQMLKDETTPWGSTGVQANWRAEASQMSATKMVTESRECPVNELYAFVLATDELLNDAPRLASRLTNKAAAAIAWKKNAAIVNGNGAGKPLGWFDSSGPIVSVAKETGQAADTVNDQNILKMYSRLLVVPGDSPFWLINRDVVPQLGALTIGNQPMWLGPQGLANAPGGMLLGYPIRFSEHAQTLGDKGDIQLISPKGYYGLNRDSAPQFARSMHLFFDYNMDAFRWTFRYGGQPHLTAAVTMPNSVGTRSNFVTLDARA